MLLDPRQIKGMTEQLEEILTAVSRTSGTSTRAAQTSLEGAMYALPQNIELNRIHLRVTGRNNAPTGKFLIYQQANGISGTQDLIASVAAFVIPAAGTEFTITPSEGDVRLVRGFCTIIWGRDSGAGGFTMQTYNTTAQNLLNNNVPTGLRPTNFDTAIAANAATAATFDPAEGGDAVGNGNTDSALVVRLEKV